MGFPGTALCGISMGSGLDESCSSTGSNYLERLKEQIPTECFSQRAKLYRSMNGDHCSCLSKFLFEI